MKKNKFNFFIGIFTTLLFLNFFFMQTETKPSNAQQLNATFNKVDGILIGTDIRISGIKVGYVNKISIENFKPKIFFFIFKNNKIPDDSSISIQTDGLFGNKYLSIEPGGSETFLKNGNKFMFTEDSILIEDLLNQIILIGKGKKKDDEL